MALEIVRRLLEAGHPVGAWNVELKARGRAPARQLNAKTIAAYLMDELVFLDYLADSCDPGWELRHDGLDERRLRYWRDQEAIPDATLRRRHRSYAKQARQLDRELGPAFLNGTPETRATLVRDWIRNWQKQGRLSCGIRSVAQRRALLRPFEDFEEALTRDIRIQRAIDYMRGREVPDSQCAQELRTPPEGYIEFYDGQSVRVAALDEYWAWRAEVLGPEAAEAERLHVAAREEERRERDRAREEARLARRRLPGTSVVRLYLSLSRVRPVA